MKFLKTLVLVGFFAIGHLALAVDTPAKLEGCKIVTATEALEAYDVALDSFDDSKLPAANMIFQCNGKDCWKSFKAFLSPYIQTAKSFVIFPDSIVSRQTFSRVFVNRANAKSSSSFCSMLKPTSPANIEAMGLVEVGFPC